MSNYVFPGGNEDMKQLILSGASDTRESYRARTFLVLANPNPKVF